MIIGLEVILITTIEKILSKVELCGAWFFIVILVRHAILVNNYLCIKCFDQVVSGIQLTISFSNVGKSIGARRSWGRQWAGQQKSLAPLYRATRDLELCLSEYAPLIAFTMKILSPFKVLTNTVNYYYPLIILAPCDYFLFPNLKKLLGGNKFGSNDEVITETSKRLFWGPRENLLFGRNFKLEKQWTKFIELKCDLCTYMYINKTFLCRKTFLFFLFFQTVIDLSNHLRILPNFRIFPRVVSIYIESSVRKDTIL